MLSNVLIKEGLRYVHHNGIGIQLRKVADFRLGIQFDDLLVDRSLRPVLSPHVVLADLWKLISNMIDTK